MYKMFLSVLNSEYEKILHSDLPESEKSEKFAEIMTEMEHNFKIPMLRDPEWEKENKSVIALYRKISRSRNFEELGSRRETMKIEQKEHDITYYLNVESHYHDKADAKGQKDAVMFEMSQESENGHETDALITCSVEEAKAFARSVLKLCEEIEESEKESD